MKPPPRIHLSRFASIPFATLIYALRRSALPALLLRTSAHRPSHAPAFHRGPPGQAIASRLFLPAVPGGYFPTTYFRLAGCRIRAHSVICAGVTIGDRARVGIRAFLRKGTTVPPGAHVASIGGMSPRDVAGLEKGFRTGR